MYSAVYSKGVQLVINASELVLRDMAGRQEYDITIIHEIKCSILLNVGE